MPGRLMSTLKDKKLIHLFSTPIMEYRWEDSDDLNRRLTDVILEKERASGGKVMSNVGGWHSEANFEQWAGDAGQELIHRVGTLVNHATREYDKLYGGKEAIRWRLTLWANVNRDGDFNQGHIHPGATWSGVYYVDAGAPSADRNDNGVLALAHPGAAAAMVFFPEITPHRHVIVPQSGLMVLFPSYLSHQVYPYWGDRPRISIAYNIKREKIT